MTHPIVRPLIEWYHQYKRSLPWRDTTDPYHIWLSEVILQQTRVAQGHDYYCRFTETYPTIADLAAAPEDDVLKLWQGLGYYSRARNLHAAAKQVIELFDGTFPSNYTDILRLKGVGAYTAAAIASFAYNLPHAVVDGNVYRVLSRLFDIDTPIDSTEGVKLFASLAQELIDLQQPGIYNQAIMEFGALQCTPTSPQCLTCPLNAQCLALSNGIVSQRPVKQGKTKITTRYFNHLYLTCGDTLWLHKREGKDIWQNLYELPLIETDINTPIDVLQTLNTFHQLLEGCGNIIIHPTPYTARHILSHRIIEARFYHIEIEHPLPHDREHIALHRDDRDLYAVSRLTHRYWEHIDKQ